jgi:hypothetical protein
MVNRDSRFCYFETSALKQEYLILHCPRSFPPKMSLAVLAGGRKIICNEAAYGYKKI